MYTTDCKYCGEHVLLDEDAQLLEDECQCAACPHQCGCIPIGMDDEPQELDFSDCPGHGLCDDQGCPAHYAGD